jgi:hypothetical protein
MSSDSMTWPEGSPVDNDITIHIKRLPMHLDFYGGNVIESCPPRGGYNPVGLRIVPDGARQK